MIVLGTEILRTNYAILKIRNRHIIISNDLIKFRINNIIRNTLIYLLICYFCIHIFVIAKVDAFCLFSEALILSF